MGQHLVKFVVMTVIGTLAFAGGRAIVRLLKGDEALSLVSVFDSKALIVGVIIAVLTISLNRNKNGA